MRTNSHETAFRVKLSPNNSGNASGSPNSPPSEQGFVVTKDRFTKVLPTLDGALSIVVRDYCQPLHTLAADGDIAVLTPQAAADPFHLYDDRLAVYIVIDGTARLELAQHPGGGPSTIHQSGPGGILVARSGVLHRLSWGTQHGLAYLFRLPRPEVSAISSAALVYVIPAAA